MFDSKEEIVNYYKTAGFIAIQISTEEKEFYYKDEEEWWQSIWSHGYRGFLKRLDEKTLKKFREESFKILSNIKNENRLPENFSVLITKARKKFTS